MCKCACSRLQAAAVAHGESLPIPEIVAIGGQSDGKSSLLEAFLGFRFNIRCTCYAACNAVHAIFLACLRQDVYLDKYAIP